MARPKDSKAKADLQSTGQGNPVQFQPIEKTTIPGEIVDQVLSMLLAGKLKVGDKLPPERHLCESLNVGRSSVREALKALETLGIIRRDIKGTTVCAPEENRYPGLSFSASTAPLEHLFETARIAGVEAAGLAAERAKPQNIAKMTRILQKNITEEAEETQAAAAVHLSFHRALVNATQNPVLTQMYNMLVALISRSLGLSSAPGELEEDQRKAFLAEIFDGHKKILSAVKSNKSSAARKAMHKHYDCMEAITPGVQAKSP